MAPVGKGASVYEEGAIKFFGSQSSIKKPIVGANAGSTCGLIVVVSVGGGEGAALFVHPNKIIIEEKIAIRVNVTFALMSFAFSTVKGNLKNRFFVL